ncbi:hypothetical protein [Mesobacillus harenae]|uniref:hypothetical protein n=1 Tax=Mesobacillus harenae TaxID=2213203 RepID=UPI0015801A45|nr:hypothetical protein [Mesobacillus harenae]
MYEHNLQIKSQCLVLLEANQSSFQSIPNFADALGQNPDQIEVSLKELADLQIIRKVEFNGKTIYHYQPPIFRKVDFPEK